MLMIFLNGKKVNEKEASEREEDVLCGGFYSDSRKQVQRACDHPGIHLGHSL